MRISPGYFFDETYEKLAMPYRSNIPKNMHVAGWGGIYGNNQYISKIELLIYHRSKCKDIFGLIDFLPTSQFCGVPSKVGSFITTVIFILIINYVNYYLN